MLWWASVSVIVMIVLFKKRGLVIGRVIDCGDEFFYFNCIWYNIAIIQAVVDSDDPELLREAAAVRAGKH